MPGNNGIVEGADRRFWGKCTKSTLAVLEAGVIQQVSRLAGQIKLVKIAVDLYGELIQRCTGEYSLHGGPRAPVIEQRDTLQVGGRLINRSGSRTRIDGWARGERRVQLNGVIIHDSCDE